MAQDFTTVHGAVVGVLMGSASDWDTMKKCPAMLAELDIPHEVNAISAHRHGERLERYIHSAEERGVKLFICAAGGAAHLAGVVASKTTLPVLGCPMKGWATDGLDSLLSTVQMPKGVPVATFAVGSHGAVNAALFAASILALEDVAVKQRWQAYRQMQAEAVQELPSA